MTEHKSENLVSDAPRHRAEWEEGWQPFHEGGPPKRGYYRVRDTQGEAGIAFMHRNRTWTLIDNARLKKPFAAWSEIH